MQFAQSVTIRDQNTKEIVFAILTKEPFSLWFYLSQSKLWIQQPFYFSMTNIKFTFHIQSGEIKKYVTFFLYVCRVHVSACDLRICVKKNAKTLQ